MNRFKYVRVVHPLAGLVAAAMLGLSAAAAAAPGSYSAMELLTSSGDTPTPTAINDFGTVVGSVARADGSTLGFIHKHISTGSFKPETFRAFPGGRYTTVTGLNEKGSMVGVASNPAEKPQRYRGYIRSGDVTTELFPAGDPGDMEVNAINGHNEVLGSWKAGGGTYAQWHAFAWNAGQITWLFTAPDDPEQFESRGIDVDHLGRWVANGAHNHGVTLPYAVNADGTVDRLDTYDTGGAIATRVQWNYSVGDDVAWVMGQTHLPAGGTSGVIYRQHEPRYFMSLGGTEASLMAMSVNNIAVGWSLIPSGQQHAMYWEFVPPEDGGWGSGITADFNDLVTNLPAGVVLTSAIGINSRGVIVALGTDGTRARNFVLLPQ